MNSYTLDTNVLSYILKGNKKLSSRITVEIDKGNEFYINPITYYEIYRGLLAINNKNKLNEFEELTNDLFKSLDFNDSVFRRAAHIYVDLRKKGTLIEDADIFIGAICLENDLVLVTNNEKHFRRIEKLKFVNWL